MRNWESYVLKILLKNVKMFTFSETKLLACVDERCWSKKSTTIPLYVALQRKYLKLVQNILILFTQM